MTTQLSIIKQELDNEFHRILKWWSNYAVDNENGGFFGKVTADNQPDIYASKGLILNARILWSFSIGYNVSKVQIYKEMADRAFTYIMNHFYDNEFGGFFMAVYADGSVKSITKETVGQAYVLYAMSEYSKTNNDKNKSQTLVICKKLYKILENKFYNELTNGYITILNRDFSFLKDAADDIVFSTQLHVLEAYINYYEVEENNAVKMAINNCIKNFVRKIFNTQTKHYSTHFNNKWQALNDDINFGHEMEASWLLYKAAIKINDCTFIKEVTEIILMISESSATAFDKDFGLWCDYKNGQMIYEKHYWGQAEALIFFKYCYEITKNEKYLQQVNNIWTYIKNNFINDKNGEWHFGRGKHNIVLFNQATVDFWKCPYHNTRACVELMAM